MHIQILYGEKCGKDSFQVVPDCPNQPRTIAPDWLLASSLRHDKYVDNWQRLTLLLKTAGGPYTVAKAAAVEPEKWQGVHWLSQYTDQYLGDDCSCKLPFAPHVSLLSSLGREEVCLDAEGVTPSFLSQLLHVLASTGTKKVVLVNPPMFFRFDEAVFTGQIGAYYSARLYTPRALQYSIKEDIAIDIENKSLKQETGYSASTVKPMPPKDLLKEAFGNLTQLAHQLLEEVELAGYTMSLKAFIEGAQQIDDTYGKIVATRLILYGYLKPRQAQVEITEKALYAMQVYRETIYS